MKRLTIFVLIMLLTVGAAYAKDFVVKKKVGEYKVEVKIDKNPPAVGENNIKVVIEDDKGKYLTDATVKIDYSMPAMPGMPPMSYKTDTVLKGNEYKATMNLSMSGPWNINVKIIRGEKQRL